MTESITDPFERMAVIEEIKFCNEEALARYASAERMKKDKNMRGFEIERHRGSCYFDRAQYLKSKLFPFEIVPDPKEES